MRALVVAVVLLSALLLAACGVSPEADTPLSAALTPTTARGANSTPDPLVITHATHTPRSGGFEARTRTPSPKPTHTSTRTPEPTATSVPLAVINSDVVNVRAGPGTNYARVAQVKLGDKFPIVGRNEDGSWWRICCVGELTDTWVMAEYVDENFAADNASTLVALAPIPPTPTPAPVAAAPAAPAAPAGRPSNAGAVAAPSAGMSLPAQGNFGTPGSVNPLTGYELPAGRNSQRPVVVCVNNDAVARPQYGIGQADVVYEYIMDGWGITRFSAIFYGTAPGRIGPVRSARLINFHLGALYDAGTICSGASDGVRYVMKKENPYPYLDIDLDDGSNTRYSSSVTRDYRTRLQTSMEAARRWLAAWQVEKAPSIRGFTFGALPAGGAAAPNVSIPYPRGSQVAYSYDAASGRYLRYLAGSAHSDGGTGRQVAVDNVIIQYTPHEKTDIVEDSLGNTSIRINLFGSGKALLFRDGQVFEVTWYSETRGDMPRFYDAGGREIPLRAGQSWISVVPFNYSIGY